MMEMPTTKASATDKCTVCGLKKVDGCNGKTVPMNRGSYYVCPNYKTFEQSVSLGENGEVKSNEKPR